MRGILMVECLYHQTIKQIKTQTRRSGGLEKVNENPDEWATPEWVEEKVSRNRTISLIEFMRHGDRSTVFQCAPRYKVDEILFLKEPYLKELIHHDPDNDYSEFRYSYKFDKQPHIQSLIKWKNKLYMPAEAGREFIKITGIRCERLMDISDQDCIAEGIELSSINGVNFHGRYKNYLPKNSWPDFNNPKSSFLSLYKFANKVKEVENIWCWVYEFQYLPDYKI